MDGSRMSHKLAAEIIGTAFLVFIGVGSVPATHMMNGEAAFTMADLGVISLAFGTVVLATVYAFGHVSGNHINPAVTLALAASGQFPWRQVPAYIAAQLVGATIGAIAIVAALGRGAVDAGLGVASYDPATGAGHAFAAEFVGTFILVLTVLLVVRYAKPEMAGVAIGFVVFAAIIPIAPATGSAINPARALGPMLVQHVSGGSVSWGQAPIYVAAELLAGLAAAATAALFLLPKTTVATTGALETTA